MKTQMEVKNGTQSFQRQPLKTFLDTDKLTDTLKSGGHRYQDYSKGYDESGINSIRGLSNRGITNLKTGTSNTIIDSIKNN